MVQDPTSPSPRTVLSYLYSFYNNTIHLIWKKAALMSDMDASNVNSQPVKFSTCQVLCEENKKTPLYWSKDTTKYWHMN